MKHWINTVSRDHLRFGERGGFTQANHGKATLLKRLSRGDQVLFYSPRTQFEGGEPLQCFTAVARVLGDEPHQVEVSSTFQPWRRRVEFLACQETPIQPLPEQLMFIPDKRRWGFPFRRGLFEIPVEDFTRIGRAMKLKLQ